MIMPVNSPQATNLLFKVIPAELQRTSTNLNGQKNDKTSIFYINDAHGKSINIERTVAASNAFDAYVSDKNHGYFKIIIRRHSAWRTINGKQGYG